MENTTAKSFVLQLGSLITLYLSVSFIIVLLFGVINVVLPDAADTIWSIESATSSIRTGIAMVLVFFPTYLILTRLVNHNRRDSTNQSYLGLTKWLIYLSLLASGLILLGDLVAVIMAFLEGDITTRFLLKAASVIVVVGATFQYYLLDAKGYWLQYEKQSIAYGAGVLFLVIIVAVAGFMHIETPSQVRETKLDNQMVGDLQDMQWRIEDYSHSTTSLPADIATIYRTFPIPTAPDGRANYEYNITGETTYELCATFSHNSYDTFGTTDVNARYLTAPVQMKNDDWSYQAGRYCFEREIDALYKQ